MADSPLACPCGGPPPAPCWPPPQPAPRELQPGPFSCPCRHRPASAAPAAAPRGRQSPPPAGPPSCVPPRPPSGPDSLPDPTCARPRKPQSGEKSKTMCGTVKIGATPA
eukprot:scaffold37581_cov26-Prasinocladus_malaysianus.AAC.4